jgi:hypothetical protein
MRRTPPPLSRLLLTWGIKQEPATTGLANSGCSLSDLKCTFSAQVLPTSNSERGTEGL